MTCYRGIISSIAFPLTGPPPIEHLDRKWDEEPAGAKDLRGRLGYCVMTGSYSNFRKAFQVLHADLRNRSLTKVHMNSIDTEALRGVIEVSRLHDFRFLLLGLT